MDDLKLIKRHYGENMMHLCRELFPTLLEEEGLLFKLLSSSFAYNKFLYDDIKDKQEIFKEYIYSLLMPEKENNEIVKYSPRELLDQAGYILYECLTESDIQKFKKYYAKNEELCTFNGNRLQKCYVFWAVKKNVDEIKREDFYGKEQRQDEYGTSVISIQFSKGRAGGILSIKNRYNHTVANPDATFSNNLDNIIPGLTEAFNREYGMNTEGKKIIFELNNYTLADDHKYHKFNFEQEGIYYCPDNKVIDFDEVIEFDKSRYIVMDNFILDLQEKKLTQYRSTAGAVQIIDSFPDGLQNIEKIEVKANKKLKRKTITINGDIEIVLNDRNQIIEYTNTHLTNIGHAFLRNNNAIEKVNLPNVKHVGIFFLHDAVKMKKIDLPKVEIIEDNFMFNARNLESINLPNVRKIGHDFISRGNTKLRGINLPKVEEIDFCFLPNAEVRHVNMPNLKKVGRYFFKCCKAKELYFPSLEEVEHEFLEFSTVEKLSMPKIKRIGCGFLMGNKTLKELDIPNAEFIDANFLDGNNAITKLSLPKVKEINERFMTFNNTLEEIDLPEVVIIGNGFLHFNQKIRSINLPNVRKIGTAFLEEDKNLYFISAPKLEKIGYNSALESNRMKSRNITAIIPNLNKSEENQKRKMKLKTRR